MSLGLDVGADSSCIKKDQRIKESCIKRIKESEETLKYGSTTLSEVRTFEIRRSTKQQPMDISADNSGLELPTNLLLENE